MNQQQPMMTLARATEFGASWNSRDPDLVAFRGNMVTLKNAFRKAYVPK